MVLVLGVLGLFHLVTENSVLKAILKKNLLFSWVSSDSVIKLKHTRLTFEENFKHNRNLFGRTAEGCELKSFLKQLAGTGVANELDLDVFSVAVNFSKRHFDASKKVGSFLDYLISSMHVGTVDDEAECSRKGAIILYFGLVFLSAYHIQVSINK